MVAYSFKAEFAPLVESGKKVHTIRNARKNGHVELGQKVQLYTGLRTKNCRKLVETDPVCWQVFEIDIYQSQNVYINEIVLNRKEVEVLALGDGFDDVQSFFDFFGEYQPRWLICWAEVDYLKKFITAYPA